MRWQITLGICYFIFHLGLSSYQNIVQLRRNTQPNESMQAATCGRLLLNVLNWTGLQGTYGFYSPRVGSSYHSVIMLGIAQEQTAVLRDPMLKSNASKIRYRSLLDIPRGWIQKQNSERPSTIRMAGKALAYSICDYVYQQKRTAVSTLQVSTIFTKHTIYSPRP